MIEYIIKKIPSDKVKHILAGMIIGYPLQVLGIILDLVFVMDIWFFILTTFSLLVFAFKEVVYDLIMGKGNCEFLDFLSSAVPVIYTFIIYYLTYNI